MYKPWRSPLVTERVEYITGLSPEGRAWLERVDEVVAELALKWKLRLGEPLDHDGYTAVIVAAETETGEQAILKLAFQHMESRDEAKGLEFWSGDPTVRLLASDPATDAMLLERCRPGHSLNDVPESEREEILARMIQRLWRAPPADHGFRHLSEMVDYWCRESRADEERWPDPALVREGLAAFEELARPRVGDVLLGTDIHAGNVLAAEREPWLVIDPKPFVGNRSYDALQHMFDKIDVVAIDPVGFVKRWSAYLGLPEKDVRAWAFARFAAERHQDDADWRRTNDVARRLRVS